MLKVFRLKLDQHLVVRQRWCMALTFLALPSAVILVHQVGRQLLSLQHWPTVRLLNMLKE